MERCLIFLLIFSCAFINHALSQCDEELVNICYPTIGDYTLIKTIPVRIKKSRKGSPPNDLRNSIIFEGGNNYKITTCNAQEFEGKLIVSIYNGNEVVYCN